MGPGDPKRKPTVPLSRIAALRVVLREVVSRATLRVVDPTDEKAVVRNIPPRPSTGGRVVLGRS